MTDKAIQKMIEAFEAADFEVGEITKSRNSESERQNFLHMKQKKGEQAGLIYASVMTDLVQIAHVYDVLFYYDLDRHIFVIHW